MASEEITSKRVWTELERVKDPEIPIVSIVEMGIVRSVSVDRGNVTVQITPTFSGCPALHVMQADVESTIREMGAVDVQVQTVLHPPWSSDWITDEARQKLKGFGLSPPPRHGGRIEVTFYDLAACPYCDSSDTMMKNAFGSTLCRSIYYCNNCQQPFEQFKAL